MNVRYYGFFSSKFFRFASDFSIGGPNCLSKMMLLNFSQGYQRRWISKYHCNTILRLLPYQVNPPVVVRMLFCVQLVSSLSSFPGCAVMVIWSAINLLAVCCLIVYCSVCTRSFQCRHCCKSAMADTTLSFATEISMALETRILDGI